MYIARFCLCSSLSGIGWEVKTGENGRSTLFRCVLTNGLVTRFWKLLNDSSDAAGTGEEEDVGGWGEEEDDCGGLGIVWTPGMINKFDDIGNICDDLYRISGDRLPDDDLVCIRSISDGVGSCIRLGSRIANSSSLYNGLSAYRKFVSRVGRDESGFVSRFGRDEVIISEDKGPVCVPDVVA